MFSSYLFPAVKSSSKNLGKNNRKAWYAIHQYAFSLNIEVGFIKNDSLIAQLYSIFEKMWDFFDHWLKFTSTA